MSFALKENFTRWGQKLVDIIDPPPPPNETQWAQYESFMLGVRAGEYTGRGTPAEYIEIKRAAHALIDGGFFNAELFNNGFKDAYGHNYDCDEQQGDVFEIGHAMSDKAFKDAQSQVRDKRSSGLIDAALRLIR